jgi:hypothetical protein
MAAHSKILGGSTAARLLGCPASVKLSADLPPQPTSTYAEEGTALHEIMECYYTVDDTDKNATTLLDYEGTTTTNGVEITIDHITDLLAPARDAVEDLFKLLDVGEYILEAPVTYTPVEGSFGTVDMLAKGRHDLVIVADYKFGHGIVSPVDNEQLKFYALAAMYDPRYKDFWTGEPDQTVVMAIIQPKNDDRPNGLWTWQTTVHELFLTDAALRLAVAAAQKGTTEPSAGEHCRWCPAAAVCPAQATAAKAINALKKEHLNDLEIALELVESLEPWIGNVKKLAHDQLMRGDKIKGYKVVPKRATRKWVEDRTELASTLRGDKKLKKADYTIEPDILSPTQLEKLCKAKGLAFHKFEKYITTKSSGLTVVPESDRRTGVEIKPETVPERMKK